jgi:hypothetical protein
MKKPIEHPLTKLADAAFQQAARKVIERAKEAATPVIICEDGEVRKVDPRRLKDGRRSRRSSNELR